MEEKLYKIGTTCILFGIVCLLKMSLFDVGFITELLGEWLPWLGLAIIGLGFYLDRR